MNPENSMKVQTVGGPSSSARGVTTAMREAMSTATIVNQVATLSLGNGAVSADCTATLVAGVSSPSAMSQ